MACGRNFLESSIEMAAADDGDSTSSSESGLFKPDTEDRRNFGSAEQLCRLMDAYFKDRFNFQTHGDGLTSLKTMRYRGINCIMKLVKLSFDHVKQLLDNHVPVHVDVKEDMKRFCQKYDMIDTILAQDFIDHARLLKLVRYMGKHGHGNAANAMLAVDGLGGPKLNNAPNVDVKKYWDNLRYSTSIGIYDRTKCWKQFHVCAVRKVYAELEKHQQEKLPLAVYKVMCTVMKEMAGIELPTIENPVVESHVMEACIDVYKSVMDEEHFKSLVEHLKTKIVHVDDEEDGGGRKRKHRKVDAKPSVEEPTLEELTGVREEDIPEDTLALDTNDE